MNQHVTIRDVAAAAGFSVNTVSRALNDKPDVSPETKARVLEAARRLGYRPNKLARGLRSNKTQTIGVIVADIANPFFGAVVKGVEEAAREHDLSIILGNTNEDYEKEEKVIQTMLSERVDGLLVTPVQTKNATIIKLEESGMPFVLLGRHFKDLETDYVASDDVQGGFLATERLIKLGHRKIAFINGPLHVSSAKERFQGYKAALERYGLVLKPTLVKNDAITMEDGYRVARLLLSHTSRPTAVFAYSDFVALGVIEAAHECGLAIPDDLSVVGYDDTNFARGLAVPLTTVHIPIDELGKLSIEILREKINGSNVTRQVRVPVKLVIRKSDAEVHAFGD